MKEGEDVETCATCIQEESMVLGLTDQDKLKDNFIKGLPDTLYNLLVLSPALELNVLISKAGVTFKLGENGNVASGPSKDGSGARQLLREERETSLVHQIEGFKIAVRN